MLGYKLCVDNLKEAYFNTSAWLHDQSIKDQKALLKEVVNLRKNNLILYEAFQSASKGESLYLEMLESILSEQGNNHITPLYPKNSSS